MTVTTGHEHAHASWTVLTTHDPQVHIAAADAAAALDDVRGLPLLAATSRLRRGPGRTCEPVARVLDKALARAEAAGIRVDRLVVVGGTAEPGPDLLRETRKLGKGTWFTVPTAGVTVDLQPQGLRGTESTTPGVPPGASGMSGTDTPPVPRRSRAGEGEGECVSAVRAALFEVLDPDLGVNIVDLGFVRDVAVDADGVVTLTMTLTSPACPVSKIIEEQIRRVLLGPAGAPATDFRIEWVWRPAWRPGDITGEGREQLAAIGFTGFTGFDETPTNERDTDPWPM